MKKIITIIIILIGLCGGLVYADSIGLIDVFSAPDTDSASSSAKIVAFPESIGDYVRAESHTGVKDECVNLAEHSDSAVRGLSGTVCTRIAIAEYRNDIEKKTVRVHLLKVINGKESYVSYIKSFSRPDSINQYEVIKLEDFELGWFPLDVFDFLLTQEQRFTLDSEGNMTMSNINDTAGQNDVTQYFINKYPPVKEADPTRSDNQLNNNNQ